MFIADYWRAACLTIQTLFFDLFCNGTRGKKKELIYYLHAFPVLPIYSSENMAGKKKNEHYHLWNIFGPSNILHTNVFNTSVYRWFSISVLQVLYTQGCLHFWLQKPMTTNTQPVGSKRLSRRIRTGVPPPVFFWELLCHRHVDLATFKYNHQSPIVGCLTDTERIFQRQYSNSHT